MFDTPARGYLKCQGIYTVAMHNIAIIGCGPAGLSAALFLQRQGHRVCIYERFSAAQPVGSGLMLQPTGLHVLEQLDIRTAVEALGQRIDSMLGRVAPNGKVVLDISYKALEEGLYGVAIHRASLFHVLHQQALQHNIPIITDHEITHLRYHQNGVSLDSQQGGATSPIYDFIVDASGRQSGLLNYAEKKAVHRKLAYGALWTTVPLSDDTFDPHRLEQRYRSASVMVGVMPCGKLPNDDSKLATLFWSLRNDQYAATSEKGLKAWKENVLQYWPSVEPLLASIEDFDQLAHARYSHHTLPKPFGHRIVFIGDSAHATSPQLGQGANMALLDSYALSKAFGLETAKDSDIETGFKDYARRRRQHVRLFQAASLSLTPFYQSDNRVLPWLRDALFEPVSSLPWVDKLTTSLGSGLMGKPVQKISR